MLCIAAISLGQEPKPIVEEVFRKEISPGQSILVTREPFDIGSLGILDAGMARKGATVASIRVELRKASGTGVLIGSAVESDFADSPNGLNVVDAFPGRDELVLVCTIGDRIGLWRIVLDLHSQVPDGWTWLRSPVRYAVRIPFGRDKLSVALVPLPESSQAKPRWSLTITDRRPTAPETFRFEQPLDTC